MSIQILLWTAVVLFAIAAAGGLIMAGIRISSESNPPAWLAMLHGLLAAAGLTLLLFAAFTVGISSTGVWALVLLIIAALGGVFLNLGYQEKRNLLPKPLMYVHALIAVVGFILLIIAAIG
jgi:glucose uptake protein GlcU